MTSESGLLIHNPYFFPGIPWIDEDGIDGVFATSSLEGAHTYGPSDNLDPDDVDDEDEASDENGKCACMFCGWRTSTEELLERHQARAHNRNTFYLCHLCEFETNWTKQFYLHCNEHWVSFSFELLENVGEIGFEVDFPMNISIFLFENPRKTLFSTNF